MPLKNTNTITLDGFDEEAAFCTFVREARQAGLDRDRQNRDRGIDDSRYAAGYQWPVTDYNWRAENNIPAMTFNQAPALLRHRLGARSRKRIGPKISPKTPGDRYDGVAQIRTGLIRNIELESDIRTVDSIVSQNQLICGIAHYEVKIDYADFDVFETDIIIKTDMNAWSVIWDDQSVEPTGRDARHVMMETIMSRKDFEKSYPDAQAVDIGSNPGSLIESQTTVTTDGKNSTLGDWVTADTVRIATVWIMRERDANMAQLTNGDIVEIGETPPESFFIPDGNDGAHTVIQMPDGSYRSRVSKAKYCIGYVTNGLQVLGEPYEMQIDRVPIVRVPAWLIHTGDRIERFGMIHFAKDALTFFNYVKSDRIERIVYRNRAAYEAQEDALSAEQTKAYSSAHKLRGGVLKYRGMKPEAVLAPQVDQAAIIETQSAQESISDIFDIRPGLSGQQGQTPPSGISLEHQMNITDTGGLIYDDLMTSAKREVYRIINQLIPYVYDAPRIVKVVGEDGKIAEAMLNNPSDPESVDVKLGKYAVDVNTGPSFETQRVQAMSAIETAMNANPEIIPIVLPELLKMMNAPGTEVMIQRLEKIAGIAVETPEAEAAAAEMAQKQAAIEEQMIQLEMQQKEFQNQKLQAEAEAKVAEAQFKLATAETARMTAETGRTEADERSRKSQAETQERFAKMEEMAERVNLLIAQTEKVYAEIDRLNATPIPKPAPPGGTKK